MGKNARSAVRARIGFAACVAAACAADLRLGIIGTDTSHVIEFTKMLNDSNSPEHVPGARVVVAFKGGSNEMPESYKRVDRFANELRTRWNIEFVPDIASLCPKVDGIMLESVDGRQHLEQTKQAVTCGRPLWIDKPLATSLQAAQEIAPVMREYHVAWFSTSSLRFSQIATSVKYRNRRALSPGARAHWVRVIWTLPGMRSTRSNCCTPLWGPAVKGSRAFIPRRRTSSRANGAKGELVKFTRCGLIPITGRWFLSVRESSPHPQKAEDSYRPLVIEIVRFFETKNPPVPNTETLETIEFMDAATRSMKSNGAPVRLR
jgi:Oxidoreductase family, NAD-binding Rossmann fold